MNNKEFLEKTYTLIEKPENWIKIHFAKKADNSPTFPGNKDACKFCLMGALKHTGFGYSGSTQQYLKIYDFVQSLIKTHSAIMYFNDADETTHKDVLKLLTKAIKTIKE